MSPRGPRPEKRAELRDRGIAELRRALANYRKNIPHIPAADRHALDLRIKAAEDKLRLLEGGGGG